jgi:hypothetical protein
MIVTGLYRRTSFDVLVEEQRRLYASCGMLGDITGNHDHRVHAHFGPFGSHVPLCKKKKPAIAHDLGWMEERTLPRETVLAIAHDQLHLGPASGAGIQDTEASPAKLGALPGYADLLVLRIGGKLFLFRHGDLYDKWYCRHPPKGDVPKRVKHYLAHAGSGAYEGIVWLRHQLKKVGGVDHFRDMEGKVKQWFNGEFRTVCTDIAQGLSREARDMERLFKIPVGGTVAGHTHCGLMGTFDGVLHANAHHCRSEVGIVLITADGVLHAPIIFADDQ